MRDSVDFKRWNECRWERLKILDNPIFHQWIPPTSDWTHFLVPWNDLFMNTTNEKVINNHDLSAECVPNRKWMKNCLIPNWYAKRKSFSFIIYRYVLCPRFLFWMVQYIYERALFISCSFFDSIMILPMINFSHFKSF